MGTIIRNGRPYSVGATTDVIADTYDSTVQYAVGDYCIHDNIFYKCNANTTGTWDSTKWDIINVSDELSDLNKPTFTEAASRTNIASGESMSTIFGKIKKYFTDLKTISFSGSAADVSYDNTTSELTATNAKDAIDELKVNVDSAATAGGTSYSNTTSGSSASTAQEAVDDLYSRVAILINNGNWRTGLRFKNLGTSFTSAQATALANGDFSEFWNGDYWVINGHNYRIWDNSGWARRRGDTNFDRNSLIIFPDDNLVAAEAFLIDDANDSGHGYLNCAYRTRTDGKGKAQCLTLCQNAFGSTHVAAHRELMSNARGAGGATSWAWGDADVELPSEVNLYGHPVWGCGLESSAYGTSFNVGDRWGQWKLAELAPYMVINRGQNYWLRDIHSASVFAAVDRYGAAARIAPSSAAYGLRPYFILV